jgi:hypothetical protein
MAEYFPFDVNLVNGPYLVTASFLDPNLKFTTSNSGSFNVDLSDLVDGGRF